MCLVDGESGEIHNLEIDEFLYNKNFYMLEFLKGNNSIFDDSR